MIRPARCGDIPGLTELGREMYLRSRYRSRGRFVPERFKAICMGAIRHHQASGTTCVFVADNGAGIEAFVLGLTDWVYGVGDRKWAWEQFWYATPGARADSAEGVFDAFVGWALKAPDVVAVRPSVNDAIDGVDYEAVGRLLRRKGFVQDGITFRREVTA